MHLLRPASALAALCALVIPLAADPPDRSRLASAPPTVSAPLDIPALAKAWASLPPVEREAAARLLVLRTDEPARLMQLRVLADRGAAPAVRRLSIEAVSGWDDARAVLPLLDVVGEAPSGPASAAQSALTRRADDPRVVRRASQLASHEAAGVRRLAFALLGASHDRRTLHLIERGLGDKDLVARAAAFAAAGRRVHVPALGALAAALSGEDIECALAAAQALSAFGSAASMAVQRGLAILVDAEAEPALRAAVPGFLTHFADRPEVRDALAAQLLQPDPAISTACRLALGAHGGVR